jgi:hypothetical protein
VAEKRKQTEAILIRFEPEQFARIKQHAEGAGYPTPAAWTRALIESAIGEPPPPTPVERLAAIEAGNNRIESLLHRMLSAIGLRPPSE